MKVHLAPKVILVTRPSIVSEGVAELLREYELSPEGWNRPTSDGDGDSIPELMGRLCYGSFGGRQGRIGAENYLSNILEGGHGSVLEHANWGFIVVRASRAHSAQLARHRSGFAHSVESTHFIRYGTEPGVKGTQEANICLTGLPESFQMAATQAAMNSVTAYNDLFTELKKDFPDTKKKDTCAAVRGLLPNALEAKHGFTANARALRHFCELRGTKDNVPEIRMVAVRVADIMMIEAPALFQDFVIFPDDDGKLSVNSNHRKV